MPKDKKPKSMVSESKAAYRTRRRPADWRKKFPKGSFWNPLTLDELIAQQGTKPFRAKEVLDKVEPWPEGEDIEDFIRAAKGDRYHKN
jgi:hypothetical protein